MDLENRDFQIGAVVLVVSLICSFIFKSLIFSCGIGSASYYLNYNFLNALFKRPLSFFDTTPIGQIINRATKDILMADSQMAMYLNHTLFNTTYVLVVMVMMAMSSPVVVIFLIFVVLIFGWLARRLAIISGDLRRLQDVNTSPMLSNVSEILTGSVIIKTYKKTEFMSKKFVESLRVSSSAMIHELIL